MAKRQGPPPDPPSKHGLPVPWYLIRERLAREWQLPPYEIDYEDMGDEVGRWLEVEALKQKYPMY